MHHLMTQLSRPTVEILDLLQYPHERCNFFITSEKKKDLRKMRWWEEDAKTAIVKK